MTTLERTRMIKKMRTRISPKALVMITRPPCLSGVISANGSDIVPLDSILMGADHPNSTVQQQVHNLNRQACWIAMSA